MKYISINLLKFMVAISILLFMGVCAWGLDRCFGSSLYNKIFVKEDCSFPIVKGYNLVYSEESKRYAIQVITYSNDLFLWRMTNRIEPMNASISAVNTFADSCKAKGFLKEYLNQKTTNFFK